MIPKSGGRFSDKIMRKQENARHGYESGSSRGMNARCNAALRPL
jgi:hypothetical protein